MIYKLSGESVKMANTVAGFETTNASTITNMSIPQDQTVNEMFKFVMNVIFMGMFCVIGLVCNILSIVTLQRDRRKMTIIILLQGLAVSDSLFLLYTLLYSTVRTAMFHHDVSEWEHHISNCIIAYVLPFGWIAHTSTLIKHLDCVFGDNRPLYSDMSPFHCWETL